MVAYLLKLKSVGEMFQAVELFLKPNESDIVLGHEEGLIVNRKYAYSVTAINIIGNTSTLIDGRLFCALIVKLILIKV